MSDPRTIDDARQRPPSGHQAEPGTPAEAGPPEKAPVRRSRALRLAAATGLATGMIYTISALSGPMTLSATAPWSSPGTDPEPAGSCERDPAATAAGHERHGTASVPCWCPVCAQALQGFSMEGGQSEASKQKVRTAILEDAELSGGR